MSINKLVAGSLMVGMGIASGNATLMATAGGVGVNWLSEAVPGLWSMLAPSVQSRPLADAYATAIRQAAQQLQADYRRTIDARSAPHSASAAFALVADCSASIAAAEFPAGVEDANSAQQALQGALAQLLHGHDARQIAFLQQHLLTSAAQHFQQQLIQNEAAWRAFHGLILQGLASNSATLLQKVDGFTSLLAAWNNPTLALQSLHASLAAVEAITQQTAAGVQRIEEKVDQLASQPASRSGPTFNNQGMEVKGNVQQAERIYSHSGHAEGGGTVTVTNIIGAPPALTTPPIQSVTPIKILFLAANPINSERLRLDQEVRTIDERLRLASLGSHFQLAQQWAVRIDDLVDALYRHKPQIVHFSGHGSPDGKLFFENALGNQVAIASGALGAIFAGIGTVRCVVLNACWSQLHAKTIANNSACVVGMRHQISDEAAIQFVAAFYRVLGEGESVQQAFALGRAQLAAALGSSGLNEQNTPRLVSKKGIDPATIHFLPASLP